MMVGFSQLDAGRAMTEHLLSAGYRRIAFLAARLDPRSNRRMAGYRAVMGEAGLADDSLMVQTKAPSSVQVGCELLREIVGRRPDVDAVFFNNDDIALGALLSCQRPGISGPVRLGLAGFTAVQISRVGARTDTNLTAA